MGENIDKDMEEIDGLNSKIQLMRNVLIETRLYININYDVTKPHPHNYDYIMMKIDEMIK